MFASHMIEARYTCEETFATLVWLSQGTVRRSMPHLVPSLLLFEVVSRTGRIEPPVAIVGRPVPPLLLVLPSMR
jgi:hypothetical protein